MSHVNFRKDLGTVARDRENIGQSLTGAFPATIPEIIAGGISAPVTFSFRK